MVLRLVNSSERKKPPTTSTPTIQANGTPGVKVAQAPTRTALISAFTVERAAEAEAPQDDRDDGLHPHGADHVRAT